MVLPVLPTRPSCECGDTLRWKRHGFFRPRYRLECVCGRCGPWRSRIERKVPDDYLRPVSDFGIFPPSAHRTTPPPAKE